MSYFEGFLKVSGTALHLAQMGQHEVRTFIFYLQQKSSFSEYTFEHPQDTGLSAHTANQSTFLDTVMQMLRLHHLESDDVWLDDGMIKVLGKENK
jgi:hypothetical protein